MKNGYFDDAAKEYVITRPDTPQSWCNYLGNTDYGAIITNNAGGYSFYKSAAQGRFLRLRFNNIPVDQPGRYFYVRDNENGDYWSTAWQPVGKSLETFHSTCRHGTGYTIISSDYEGISTEATYFVPLEQEFEYWRLRIANHSDRVRKLSLFTFCEFSNNWDTTQDQVNLQYSLFIVKGEMRDGLLRISINDHLPEDHDHFVNNDQSRHAWMGMVGSPVTGFETARDHFLGPYRSYNRPLVVEQGKCENSCAYGDNACGTLQSMVTLQPGEEKEVLVLLGIGDVDPRGLRIFREFGSFSRMDQELLKVKEKWHSLLDNFWVETPDANFNSTINVWVLYNCLVTFNWSRSASLVYNGERNGLGFRDSVQDVLGILTADPEAVRKRLELMLTGQLANGGAMPVIQPFNHHPGREKGPGEEHFRSDDCLWFFNAIPAYVAETGDVRFYAKILPYADDGEASVLGHLRQALEFNLSRSGKHGLPCGLEADWNDCLKLGYHGESLFVAFQVVLGLKVYSEIALSLGMQADAEWALSEQAALSTTIQAHCWDGKWFIWAIGEDGTVYGTKDSPEGQVYLNTQLWSVISGAATPDQARQCMET
ncbi:MAG: N,N'-diacetylchitobiose phosphorylase, partial [Anaerolineaceae bacterium]|nr:N,N'-diacetylchitobiose phosphorylase [Anaerolineaceae bacterium]